jgi:hypothetical protein
MLAHAAPIARAFEPEAAVLVCAHAFPTCLFVLVLFVLVLVCARAFPTQAASAAAPVSAAGAVPLDNAHYLRQHFAAAASTASEASAAGPFASPRPPPQVFTLPPCSPPPPVSCGLEAFSTV